MRQWVQTIEFKDLLDSEADWEQVQAAIVARLRPVKLLPELSEFQFDYDNLVNDLEMSCSVNEFDANLGQLYDLGDFCGIWFGI